MSCPRCNSGAYMLKGGGRAKCRNCGKTYNAPDTAARQAREAAHFTADVPPSDLPSYEDLLERWPQWRERVVFGAFVYASREGLAEYLAYRQEVETLVARINGRWGTDTWTPILLDTGDDFPASVAALRLYDVLLVNPIRDGLNLVATEGCLVNENDGVLLLSPEAGAFERLGDAVVRVNPFDVASTAEALHEALSLAPPARAAHAARLRALAEARSPSDWLREQRAAAEA